MIGELQFYQPSDAEAVARLHRHIYHRTDAPPSAELVAYYRRIFFENPWFDDRLPSMIFRSGDGQVCGFMGLIPRPWSFDGRMIQSVVAHRLMVPDWVPNRSLVAARLVRASLKGPHDLLVNDGSSEAGRSAVTAVGAVSIPQYSMRWIVPLKPAGWWREQASQRPKLRALSALARPLVAVADRVAASRATAPPPDASLVQAPLTTEELLESIDRATHTLRLRPRHTLESLEWMLGEMRADPWRQGLDGFTLRRGDRLIGACLFHSLARGGIEVDVIAGENVTANRQLLLAILALARQQGVTHVFGRFEPRLAQPLWELGCLLRPTPDCWTVAYSRHTEIIQQFEAGKVFLSNLDAELWLGVPMSYSE